jgi:penicillin-binding protein 1A
MLRTFTLLISTLFLFAIVGMACVVGLFWHYGRDLPDYHQLDHYEPPVTTRVYAGDGRLVAEYAVEKRSFVPISAIPQRVIQAVVAAEDKNFFQHSGIDPWGLLRAALQDAKWKLTGSSRRPIGASTITQQVAKHFLLTNEVSMSRKIKEAILAFRIEHTFTKQHILELYLNEEFLGRSYGVAAAALEYFDKNLDDLTIGEAAFIASLLKAPGRDPQSFHDRRDYVIGRMEEDGYITVQEAKAALAEPIEIRPRQEAVLVPGGDYFAEDIRRELADQFGEAALYKGGLQVRSTLDPALQEIASRTLRAGLVAYDRRHGWRGPLGSVDTGAGWSKRLTPYVQRPDLAPWIPAVVLSLSETHAEIGLPGGRKGHIPMSELHWARPPMPNQTVGPMPKRPADVLKVGDVVAVESAAKSEDGKELYPADSFALRQLPKVEGALVAMDPHTGRVLAMQGGFSYARSQFNRATQAFRQPGSSFKPFVYMAALDSGYTPSSLVVDGPVEFDQGPGLPKWRPVNYHGDFLGPTTLRVGVEKSRNLMTVRLAAAIGMPKVASYAERFGVVDKLPHELAMALGACDTTPMRMATAYSQIVNGGFKITPTLIDRIQDRTGKTIYRHDERPCEACAATFYTDQAMPDVPDTRPQIIDAMTAYQMVHILEGVVQRGTGRIIAALGKPLAGKTGTTNDSKDTWFVGFSPDLTVAVFVGFDDPQTLGEHETGASAAAPIFRDFMADALKDKPPTPFRVPPGIRLVRVDAGTGRPAEIGDTNVIYEAFKPGSVPSGAEEEVLDNGEVTDRAAFGDSAGGVALPTSEYDTGAEPNARPVLRPGAPAPAAPSTPTAPPAPPARAGEPEAGGLY